MSTKSSTSNINILKQGLAKKNALKKSVAGKKAPVPKNAKGNKVTKVTKSKIVKSEDTNLNLIIYDDNGIFRTHVVERSKFDLEKLQLKVKNIIKIVPFEIHKKTKSSDSKYGAIKCEDETGKLFDSKLELIVSKEFVAYKDLGYIKNDLEFQKTFSFQQINLKRTYTPDFLFTANKNFIIETSKGPLRFIKDTFYVCDVKSAGTIKDGTFSWKKSLMKAVFDIKVTPIVKKFSFRSFKK